MMTINRKELFALFKIWLEFGVYRTGNDCNTITTCFSIH